MNRRRDPRLAGLGLIGRLGRKRDERGAMLLLAAAGLIVAMVFAALAIDIGFLAADKRSDQKMADLAAMDAARDLGNIQALANASVARNYHTTRDAFPTTVAQLVSKDPITGNYVADMNGKFVKVTVTSPRKPFFPFVSGTTRTVTAVAVAGAQDVASFSLGSGLANLNTNASILDQFFGGMLKVPGTVSLLSYQGLANSTISLSVLQQALLAQGLAVGSPDELMNTNLTMAQLLTATATGLSGPATATLDINQLATKVGPVGTVRLGDFINLAQPASTAAMETQVNVFQFVNAAAQVANGTSAISIPTMNAGIPNVGNVGVTVNLIEKEKIYIGPTTGTQPHAKTSQLTVTVTPTITAAGLVNVTIPLTVNAASAIGNLTAVGCGTPRSLTVVADTTGASVTGSAAASVIGIALPVNLTVSATVANPGPFAAQTFNYAGDFGAPGARTLGTPMASLNNATIGLTTGVALVDALNGLLLGNVLNNVLKPALGAIDDAVVRPILQALGATLGTATITALPIPPDGVKCGDIRLVL